MRFLQASWFFVAISWLPAASQAQTHVSVNLAEPADYPLLKDKLNLYNTSLPSTQELERDAPLLGLLNLESMRLEQAWGYGQTLSNVVGGGAGNLSFDFSAPDRWLRLIRGQGVALHWSYDYTPRALSGSPGDVPPEPGWSQCVEKAWQHWHAGSEPILLHEVWNEPDFPALGFFKGSEQDYYELYSRTAKQLRALDPDAKIAGPTTAFPFWLNAFTDYVREHQLPLDTLTFHQYTRLDGNDHIAQAASALSRYPEFATVELVMDEYHPYNPWPKDGPQQTFEGATDLLYDALRFARRPELTSLNWAQFQEPGHNTDQFLGLVTVDGHPKASFNALRLYGMLPVDSVAVTVTGATLDVLASADEHRAGIVLLNRTGAEQSVDLALTGAGFARAKVETYRIDATHNSYLNGAGEHLTASDTQDDVAVAGWTFAGTLPNMGTLAFLFDDGSPLPQKTLKLGKTVRVNRYYPSRGTSAYADFDRRTWVARLGMANEARANAQVGVTVEGLPAALRFSSKLSGESELLDKNSLLGVRLDFQVGSVYAKSVLFHGGIYDPARDAAMPFGSKQQADSVVEVADFGDFVVKLADYAPPGATGRVQLSYVMQNTGPGTRAVIRTSAVDSDMPSAGTGGSAGAAGTAGAGGSNQGGIAGVASFAGSSSPDRGGAAALPGFDAAGTRPVAPPSSSSGSCACRAGATPASQRSTWLVALALVTSSLWRRRGSTASRAEDRRSWARSQGCSTSAPRRGAT